MAAQFATRHVNDFFRSLDQKLEPPVKDHLKKVYSTLAYASLSAAAGSYVYLYTGMVLGSLLSAGALLGTLGFALALTLTPDNGKNTQKRMNYLLALAACMGASTGPLIEIAMFLNPKIVPMAMLSTFLVFGSFSLSSIFSSHSKWLYLTGGLMSLMTIISFTSLINIVVRSYFLFQAELYLGLILFCLFIMYDTSLIIEKRRMGSTDHIGHATMLFMDIGQLFTRLLVLLVQKERSNNNNNRNSRNRR